MRLRTFAAVAAAAVLPIVALAQGMPPMGAMPGMSGGAAAAYAAANDAMMMNMAIELTGNPDRDFALMMIPHHQGAIDMARIELEYGTDPELRALAEAIIAAQEEEIAFLQAWLAANP